MSSARSAYLNAPPRVPEPAEIPSRERAVLRVMAVGPLFRVHNGWTRRLAPRVSLQLAGRLSTRQLIRQAIVGGQLAIEITATGRLFLEKLKEGRR
jgi:hypothetical protein